ncbi:hypothetical protein AK812_SmicGene19497 [Symbiodinium microadriaticum]|uniref:Uncharacterized protein n=1 Tax=Symbiodinium microadriaticum TaxID=2951 RepID=A0A1Q9DSD1_SYMMI|nr:hypothetical protein AK812_SmicGene19497 [Symbiodinium microadriaticum]
MLPFCSRAGGLPSRSDGCAKPPQAPKQSPRGGGHGINGASGDNAGRAATTAGMQGTDQTNGGGGGVDCRAHPETTILPDYVGMSRHAAGKRPGAAAGKEPEEGGSVRAPPAAGFNAQHDEAAAAGVANFWVSALAGCSQWRHDCGVDRNLDPSPERQAVCYDFDAAVIVTAGCDIQDTRSEEACLRVQWSGSAGIKLAKVLHPHRQGAEPESSTALAKQ